MNATNKLLVVTNLDSNRMTVNPQITTPNMTGSNTQQVVAVNLVSEAELRVKLAELDQKLAEGFIKLWGMPYKR